MNDWKIPMNPKTRLLILLWLSASLLTGCGTITRASQRPPEPMTVVKPQIPELRDPKKGSIWQSADRNSLFNKARNVGDIVVVTVAETSTAQKTAATNLSRDDKNQLDVGNPFGITGALAAKGYQYLGLGGTNANAKIEGKHDFTGKGTTSRNGSITTTISCTVTEVLVNGNLRIEGRRDITVNHENQFIILSGVIRPEDINQNNVVQSSQIADARIDYSGDGDVDEQQRPGWISQFLANFRIL